MTRAFTVALLWLVAAVSWAQPSPTPTDAPAASITPEDGAVSEVAPVPAVTAPKGCTARDVQRGHFGGLESAKARCVLPSDTSLLDPPTATTLASETAPYTARVDALRVLARRASDEPQWGHAFALRVLSALDRFDPKQCSQLWDTGFASVQVPLPMQTDCQCAFIAASDGDPSYACYRFADAAHAPLPVCEVPRMRVVDLPDWDAAARVLAYHRLADSALLTLGKTCVAKAIDRLKSAEHKWQALAKNGYVQYPWELLVSRVFSGDYANYNACFASDKSCDGEQGLDPTRTRVIFLHPGIGLGFPGFGQNDGKPQPRGRVVVATELAGATFYPEDFSWYLGASAAIGFQDADFARPRLGGLIHLSHWLQVGYLHGFGSTTKGEGTLYLSVDVLGMTSRQLGLVEPQAKP